MSTSTIVRITESCERLRSALLATGFMFWCSLVARQGPESSVCGKHKRATSDDMTKTSYKAWHEARRKALRQLATTSDAEDAEIRAGIAQDPDAFQLTD